MTSDAKGVRLIRFDSKVKKVARKNQREFNFFLGCSILLGVVGRLNPKGNPSSLVNSNQVEGTRWGRKIEGLSVFDAHLSTGCVHKYTNLFSE